MYDAVVSHAAVPGNKDICHCALSLAMVVGVSHACWVALGWDQV